jgi:hypothetical protein
LTSDQPYKMKIFGLLFTVSLIDVAVAQYKLEITIPPTKASIKKLEDCICEAVVAEMGGTCEFKRRRLTDTAGQADVQRVLQGGSCANCNPGPSGYWCRLITCRRRVLAESEGESEPSSVTIQDDINACLSMKIGEGVHVFATPAN